MIDQIILGIVQGVAEWLPVSSEGLIVLIKTNFLKSPESFELLIQNALSLHFGTFLAALVYFRKDVQKLFQSFLHYKSSAEETKKLLLFLIISTLISGTLGLLLLKIFGNLFDQSRTSANLINGSVGFLLLITAILELKSDKKGYREIKDIRILDGIVLGIVQGFAALPGLSRSGLTVSALLLRKFNKTYALKISFLMSLPIVLAGNIIINIQEIVISWNMLAGIVTSFAFGLATIHLLFRIAKKINFGYFVLVFGLFMILSTLL